MKSMWFKKTVRMISVLVIAALLFAVAGCGAKEAAEQENAGAAGSDAPKAAGDKAVTLKMITWVQETNEKAIKDLNDAFTKKYPNVEIVVDTVAPNDYPTLQNTRISAGDVDLLTSLSAFDTLPQDFTKGCDKPAWQTFVESGAYLDITDQPFLKNWDPNMLKNASSYNGKVFGIDMGAVGYNGLFYNKKLFDENGLKEPGTWDEFVKICETFKAKNIAPITLGMKDGWPLDAIGVSGLVGANEEDLTAFAKGLWTGTRKLTDEQTMKIWNRADQFVSYLEKNVQSVTYGDAPGRFVAGKAAMLYDGTWNNGTITALDKDFQFGYFALPGDKDGKPNQLQGKYDMQFHVYSKTANKDTCLKWMEFLSQKENYTEFVSTIGFFPTMPGVVSKNTFINSLADKNTGFKASWEKVLVAPKGVGQYAKGQGFVLSQLKAVGGTVPDVKALADLAQKDWDAGLKAAQ